MGQSLALDTIRPLGLKPGQELLMIQDQEFRVLSTIDSVTQEILPVPGPGVGKCFEVFGKNSPCEECPVQEAIETGKECCREMTFENAVKIFMRAVPLFDPQGNVRSVLKFITDSQASSEKLSREKEALNHLMESIARFEQLSDSTPVIVFETDTSGTVTFFNKNTSKMFGYSEEELANNFQSLNFIHPHDHSRALMAFHKKIRGDFFNEDAAEYTAVRRDSSQFPITSRSNLIYRDGKLAGMRMFYFDITERKQMQHHLEYTSRYDALTGLFNRTVFEENLRELEEEETPAGIIVADINGLKIVNDTHGYELGNVYLQSAAEAIKSCLCKGCLAARTGGDDFSILLRNTSEKFVRELSRNIKSAAMELNPEKESGFPLSISTGWAIAYRPENIFEALKQAEDNMTREKLHQSQSIRSRYVRTLMNTLEARDSITKNHSEDMFRLIKLMGTALNLNDQAIKDLCLLAQFHDIGKIGVPDRLLLKPGPLTPGEKLEMQRHCEIGHRIAMSAPELVPIADWILKHHEWWNGGGYPLGLKREQIPFECRLLAIVDAYEAMTSHRPYRQPVSHEEAVNEIIRCAGTQFDPALVDIFIKIDPEGKEVKL